MSQEDYTKRELDLQFKNLNQKLDNHSSIHEEILIQVKLTNGKVKKIIIVLIALGFYVLGAVDVGLKEIFRTFV